MKKKQNHKTSLKMIKEPSTMLERFKFFNKKGAEYFVGTRLKKLCDDLVMYAQKKESYHLPTFIARYGIALELWENLLQKRPVLKKCYQFACLLVECNMLEKKGIDAYMRLLYQTSPRRKEALEYEQSLKNGQYTQEYVAPITIPFLVEEKEQPTHIKEIPTNSSVLNGDFTSAQDFQKASPASVFQINHKERIKFDPARMLCNQLPMTRQADA